jgi:hypothetical protein
MTVSQNGWPANNIGLTAVWSIPGTIRTVRLQHGDAGYLLTHFASWFDHFVEDIESGELDDWGYAERPIRGGTALSNHASGTAIDLNATKHPLGISGTFSLTKQALIRAQLLTYKGCIRWGADYSGRKDEMHFEINRDPNTVHEVADELRSVPMADARDVWAFPVHDNYTGNPNDTMAAGVSLEWATANAALARDAANAARDSVTRIEAAINANNVAVMGVLNAILSRLDQTSE